jgi:hypothetical protein
MRIHNAVGLVLGFVLSACTAHDAAHKDAPASGGGATNGDASANSSTPPSTDALDPSLVGNWYTGRGGTTFPYDSQTGAWGTPTGDGMVFMFRADGSYTKGVQSYVSTADCTTGWTATEDGTATSKGGDLSLHPTRGHMIFTASCSTSEDSEKDIAVQDETLTWALGPYAADPSMTGLTLTNASGASSQFRRVQ